MEIIGALIGFGGSAFPSICKYFQDKSDKKHEIEVMKLQINAQEKSHNQKLEEINISADIKESENLYRTFYSGIKWIDAFNGSVRPMLAYAFFLLYGYVKIAYFVKYGGELTDIWTSIDNTIFLTIISYFFGQRSMQKLLK